MDKKTRAHLKERISLEIRNLRSRVASQSGTAPVEPDQAIGRLSRLDNMINQSVADAALAKAKQRILKLEAALIRANKDPCFGECEECGEPIAEARLLALPESTLCVECAD